MPTKNGINVKSSWKKNLRNNVFSQIIMQKKQFFFSEKDDYNLTTTFLKKNLKTHKLMKHFAALKLHNPSEQQQRMHL